MQIVCDAASSFTTTQIQSKTTVLIVALNIFAKVSFTALILDAARETDTIRL